MSISVVKCGEVLQCNGGTSNKVSNIIIRHTDNRKLLLICRIYMGVKRRKWKDWGKNMCNVVGKNIRNYIQYFLCFPYVHFC